MSSAKTKTKRKGPELRVVFDTSVLYTGSASDLVQEEVAAVIRDHSQHPDLAITWHLPSVVRHERQFQMQTKALNLLPSIQKLERLLSHQLNITEPMLEERVNAAVEKQTQELDLKTIEVDSARVDLSRLILDACYRRPPFKVGESEKGFRDSMIIEAFLQLVEISPKTSQRCRAILVTGDNLLADAVRTRTCDATNVHVLGSLEELKGLISTLTEQVTEEFVQRYIDKAKVFFFDYTKEEGLYFKHNINASIKERFAEALASKPDGADLREHGTWKIGPPRFVKKRRQRVFWATRVSVEAKAYKWTTRYVEPYYASGLLGPTMAGIQSIDSPALGPYILPDQVNIGGWGTGDVGFAPGVWEAKGIFPNMLGDQSTQSVKKLVSSGKSVFEVHWSVTITTTGKFTSPNVESVEHVGTNWD